MSFGKKSCLNGDRCDEDHGGDGEFKSGDTIPILKRLNGWWDRILIMMASLLIDGLIYHPTPKKDPLIFLIKGVYFPSIDTPSIKGYHQENSVI